MNAALIPKYPNRPLVGIRAIERLLLRHAFAPKPEAKLMVAVICQGMADAVSVDDYVRRRAIRFLKGHNLERIAELIGLHPEFVRQVAQQANYLTNDLPASQKKRKRKSGAK